MIGHFVQSISLPLHHIRPKLLRPLVFPGKRHNAKKNKKHQSNYTDKGIELPVSERDRIGIQPTRAIIARYIAVVMFDRKTMA